LTQPIAAGKYVLAVTVPGQGTKRVDVEVEAFEVSQVRVQF
jgi:hypothetical protein